MTKYLICDICVYETPLYVIHNKFIDFTFVENTVRLASILFYITISIYRPTVRLAIQSPLLLSLHP